MNNREYLEKYLKIMSKFSASVIRSREHKPLGYGKFYLEESKTDVELSLTVLYKQSGYKDHYILRKKYHIYNKEHIEEFYASFLDEVLIAFVALKTGEFRLGDGTVVKIYTIGDLINKGLPDEDKLDYEQSKNNK